MIRDKNGKIESWGLSVTRELLLAGADPNVQDPDGNTPLHISREKELTDLLLEYGANPNIRNKAGELPDLNQPVKRFD
jgi:ankyrin repeat protein